MVSEKEYSNEVVTSLDPSTNEVSKQSDNAGTLESEVVSVGTVEIVDDTIPENNQEFNKPELDEEPDFESEKDEISNDENVEEAGKAEEEEEKEEEESEKEEEEDGGSIYQSSLNPSLVSKEEAARLMLLRQQLDEMSPLFLPHTYTMLPDSFDENDYPQSYKQQTEREIRLLAYADNFRRQYANLYSDRTRLMLTPTNECGQRKFVCTTIRPTKLPYAELYNWDGAAAFVADFLNFVPLVPSTELPTRLLSPFTCLQIQMGTCFEYTALLCALLIGTGYDAYVVSGYATRECCYVDESRKTCPLLEEVVVTPSPIEDVSVKKYQVKPVKDFNSKYELSLEVQKMLNEKRQAEIDLQASQQVLIENEKPLPDPLYGLRVHSWILILAGRRDITESFFIEPLTGLSVDIKSSMYLGIESVWNHMNYWINMQDCSNGISGMRYNLRVLSDWEYMLSSGVLNELAMPHDTQLVGISKRGLDVTDKLAKFTTALDYGFETQTEPEVIKIIKNKSHSAITSIDPESEVSTKKPIADLNDKLLLFDLPYSWTLPIVLSMIDFDKRYPDFKKEIIYNRAKLEKFSPYSQATGMVSKLTIYADRELIIPLEEREIFKWRKDKLISRRTDLKTSWVTELFDHGRMTSQLQEHSYRKSSTGIDVKRCMKFYDKVRVDGLVKRERTAHQLIETYRDRKDRLVYREAQYGRTVKKFGPTTVLPKDCTVACFTTSSFCAIDKIIERFSRNPNIDADEDIAEIAYGISEEKYYITYHIADDKIFPCTREFIKPPVTDDRKQTVELFSDTHTAFYTTANPKLKTTVEIYNMLVDLIALEQVAKENIRRSEREVGAILAERQNEETNPKLELSLFDTLRNHDMHNLRIALEEHAEKERQRQKEIELDYLAPFLEMKNADSDTLTREQAFSVREACLQGLKERLIKKANIIQSRFELETQALQSKQQWYQLNQINLTSDDEVVYLKYCNDAIFRITTLETMLMRHKHTAPQKYMALEKKLRSDLRLAEFLHTG